MYIVRCVGRVGRRHTFIISATLPAFAGLARAFSTNYSMYVALEYFEALLGSGAYTTGYILGTASSCFRILYRIES